MSNTVAKLAAVAADRVSGEDAWPATCLCCGSGRIRFDPVLWPSLIAEWRLTSQEAAYIDRQQGLRCRDCGAALRTMALALAVMRCYGYEGRFADWVRTRSARALRVLEVNEAGQLTPYLEQLPGFVPARYPDIDVQVLPYEKNAFDLVVHSDTLEHVPDPVGALGECCRVLRPGGLCAFTVPMIVNRMTRSRDGLPPSYHGFADERAADWMVRTEYGADAWRHVIEAGFAECRVVSLAYPVAQALVGEKALMSLLEPTGERYLPEQPGRIRYEHLHRYYLANDLVAGKDVLDIACGEGYGCDLMADAAAQVIGVDIDEETIRRARQTYAERGNLRFLAGGCEAIPLADHSVDVVTSFETIEHHDKHEQMLGEIKRVLRPGGLLVLSSPNRPVYSEETGYANPFHVKELDENELVSLLRRYFGVVRLYGQRMWSGSFVYARHGQQGPNFRAILDGSAVAGVKERHGFLPPMYSLAVCSDAQTGDAAANLQSIYLDARDDVLKSVENRLDFVMQDLSRHTQNLAREVDNLQKHSDNLTHNNEELTRHNENLTSCNEEARHSIGELQSHLESLQEQNQRLSHQIIEQEPQIEMLNNILGSKRWQMAQKIARLHDRVWPFKSRNH